MLKDMLQKFVVGMVFFLSTSIFAQSSHISLTSVHIVNKTGFTVKGIVNYRGSVICSKDKYLIQPYSEWQAASRGFCMVTSISVTGDDRHGYKYMGMPYTSSVGTTKHDFQILLRTDNQLQVIPLAEIGVGRI